jgi:hypothetical protein
MMTGGGDTDEFEDIPVPGEGDEGGTVENDTTDAEVLDAEINENDDDPTAGASDIGGRAGEP